MVYKTTNQEIVTGKKCQANHFFCSRPQYLNIILFKNTLTTVLPLDRINPSLTALYQYGITKQRE